MGKVLRWAGATLVVLPGLIAELLLALSLITRSKPGKVYDIHI